MTDADRDVIDLRDSDNEDAFPATAAAGPRSKRRRHNGDAADVQRSILSSGRPVDIAWGPVLKAYRAKQPNHAPSSLLWSHADILTKAGASNDSTWMWSLVGV